MKGSTLAVISLIVLAIAGIFLLFPLAFTAEFVPSERPPMNASISQVFSIQLSGNLSTGIFFTNTTTIGVQYAITNVSTWNNATANYWGVNYGTEYYVTAGAGNTLNVKICQCACEDLECSAGDCTGYKIFINGTGCAGTQGVGWANGTIANFNVHVPPSADYIFPGPDQFQVVNGSLPAGASVYLRYWLDPCPDNVPSGTYNTTYMFKAVDYTADCGTCSC